MQQLFIRYKRSIIIICISLVFLYLLFFLWEVLYPFVIAAVIAYIVDPIVIFLERNKYARIPRIWGIIIVFVLFFGFLSLFIYLMIPSQEILDSLVSFFNQISTYLEPKEFGENFRTLQLQLIEAAPFLGNFIDLNDNTLALQVRETLYDIFSGITGDLLGLLQNVSGLLINLILIPLGVFYLLKDKHLLFDLLKKYTEEEKERKVRGFYDQIHKKIGGYIKAMFLSALVVMVLVSIAFTIWGIHYAFGIGLICGITILIPYIGPIIGLLAGIVVTLGSDLSTVLFAAIFILVSNTFAGFFIQPKIISKTSQIHPLLVIIVVLCGYQLLGLRGMILAVPIALICQVILKGLFDKYIKEI